MLQQINEGSSPFSSHLRRTILRRRYGSQSGAGQWQGEPMSDAQIQSGGTASEEATPEEQGFFSGGCERPVRPEVSARYNRDHWPDY